MLEMANGKGLSEELDPSMVFIAS